MTMGVLMVQQRKGRESARAWGDPYLSATVLNHKRNNCSTRAVIQTDLARWRRKKRNDR